MLVLTRKHGEKILIGDDIVITVLETRRDGVRIGIDAPNGVKIQRDEVLRAVTEANVAATEVDPDAENRIKALLGLISAPANGPTSRVAGSAALSAPNPTSSPTRGLVSHESAASKPTPRGKGSDSASSGP